MRKQILLMGLVLLATAGLPGGATAGTPQQWLVHMDPGAGGPDHEGFEMGARPGYQDGYDDQLPLPIQGLQGSFFLLYRKHDLAKWPPLSGFCWYDYESPIPPGGSKTWWDIYLWAQNYTPPAKTTNCGVGPAMYSLTPPAGYTAKIFLEYVPASCEWTGPMEIEFDPTVPFQHITLPIAEVTDPLQGTKMHITVYAPLPEPSCLAALALGLAGAGVLRRRA